MIKIRSVIAEIVLLLLLFVLLFLLMLLTFMKIIMLSLLLLIQKLSFKVWSKSGLWHLRYCWYGACVVGGCKIIFNHVKPNLSYVRWSCGWMRGFDKKARIEPIISLREIDLKPNVKIVKLGSVCRHLIAYLEKSFHILWDLFVKIK